MLAEHLSQTQRASVRQARMRGARAMLQRLMGYPGETWEQRWLASGCDAAPRGWMDHFDAAELTSTWSPTLLGMNALLQNPGAAAVLQLAARLPRQRSTSAHFSTLTAGNALASCASYPTTKPRCRGSSTTLKPGSRG